MAKKPYTKPTLRRIPPEEAERLKRATYAAAYGAGDVRQGAILGQYPPPDLTGSKVKK